jgi:hypothetical protein
VGSYRNLVNSMKKCQAFEGEKACPNQFGLEEVEYFGHPELYWPPEPLVVKVTLCSKHRGKPPQPAMVEEPTFFCPWEEFVTVDATA